MSLAMIFVFRVFHDINELGLIEGLLCNLLPTYKSGKTIKAILGESTIHTRIKSTTWTEIFIALIITQVALRAGIFSSLTESFFDRLDFVEPTTWLLVMGFGFLITIGVCSLLWKNQQDPIRYEFPTTQPHEDAIKKFQEIAYGMFNNFENKLALFETEQKKKAQQMSSYLETLSCELPAMRREMNALQTKSEKNYSTRLVLNERCLSARQKAESLQTENDLMRKQIEERQDLETLLSYREEKNGAEIQEIKALLKTREEKVLKTTMEQLKARIKKSEAKQIEAMQKLQASNHELQQSSALTVKEFAALVRGVEAQHTIEVRELKGILQSKEESAVASGVLELKNIVRENQERNVCEVRELKLAVQKLKVKPYHRHLSKTTTNIAAAVTVPALKPSIETAVPNTDQPVPPKTPTKHFEHRTSSSNDAKSSEKPQSGLKDLPDTNCLTIVAPTHTKLADPFTEFTTINDDDDEEEMAPATPSETPQSELEIIDPDLLSQAPKDQSFNDQLNDELSVPEGDHSSFTEGLESITFPGAETAAFDGNKTLEVKLLPTTTAKDNFDQSNFDQDEIEALSPFGTALETDVLYPIAEEPELEEAANTIKKAPVQTDGAGNPPVISKISDRKDMESKHPAHTTGLVLNYNDQPAVPGLSLTAEDNEQKPKAPTTHPRSLDSVDSQNDDVNIFTSTTDAVQPKVRKVLKPRSPKKVSEKPTSGNATSPFKDLFKVNYQDGTTAEPSKLPATQPEQRPTAFSPNGWQSFLANGPSIFKTENPNTTAEPVVTRAKARQIGSSSSSVVPLSKPLASEQVSFSNSSFSFGMKNTEGASTFSFRAKPETEVEQKKERSEETVTSSKAQTVAPDIFAGDSSAIKKEQKALVTPIPVQTKQLDQVSKLAEARTITKSTYHGLGMKKDTKMAENDTKKDRAATKPKQDQEAKNMLATASTTSTATTGKTAPTTVVPASGSTATTTERHAGPSTPKYWEPISAQMSTRSPFSPKTSSQLTPSRIPAANPVNAVRIPSRGIPVRTPLANRKSGPSNIATYAPNTPSPLGKKDSTMAATKTDAVTATASHTAIRSSSSQKTRVGVPNNIATATNTAPDNEGNLASALDKPSTGVTGLASQSLASPRTEECKDHMAHLLKNKQWQHPAPSAKTCPAPTLEISSPANVVPVWQSTTPASTKTTASRGVNEGGSAALATAGNSSALTSGTINNGSLRSSGTTSTCAATAITNPPRNVLTSISASAPVVEEMDCSPTTAVAANPTSTPSASAHHVVATPAPTHITAAVIPNSNIQVTEGDSDMIDCPPSETAASVNPTDKSPIEDSTMADTPTASTPDPADTSAVEEDSFMVDTPTPAPTASPASTATAIPSKIPVPTSAAKDTMKSTTASPGVLEEKMPNYKKKAIRSKKEKSVFFGRR